MANAQPNQPGISNATVHYTAASTKNDRQTAANSDATGRVRYLPPTTYSDTPSNRTDYPTTSDKFSKTQYSGGVPTTPVGLASDPTARRDNKVRNPVVAYTTPTKTANTNKPTQTTDSKVTAKTTARSKYNTGLRPSPQPKERRKKRGIKRLAATAYNLAARTSLLGTYAWTGFSWSFIQLPLAILATVFVGVIIGIEALVGNGIVQDLFLAAMSQFGIDWDFQLAAFVCYAVLIAFCYLQLAGIWLQCAMTGMHPTSGRGGALKFSALLLCLVLYWVPLVNILPIAWLWVFSISLYPR